MRFLCRGIVIVLALISCAGPLWADEMRFEIAEKSDKKTSKMVKPEIIIEIKRGVLDPGKELGIVPREKVRINSESLNELNKRYGLVSVEKLFSGTHKDVPSDIYVLRFPPEVDINEAISSYEKEENVVYAESNHSVSAR